MVFNSLVSRSLSGELSPTELSQFQEALRQDPDLENRLEEFRKVWDSMDGMAGRVDYDMDAEWNALRGKIPDFEEHVHGPAKLRSLLYYTYRIAAVLVIGLVIAFAWIYATQYAGTEVLTAGTEALEIRLGDGTHVLLNRDSKIRYRKPFKGDCREIRLAGEAWFDVAKDTTRPFIIDAGTAIVQVLGTSFNVNAYRENPMIEITVESGVVAVTAKEDKDELIVLKAGNSGTYNSSSRELKLIPVSNPNTLAWLTKNLYFEDTPLREVAALIGKVYNVKFVIPDPGIADCPITVSFSDQSLEAVLNVLELTLDLEISRKDGETYTLKGTVCVE
jgi:ferric-dicitrate binding protein FerR (iron transport regulator)